MECTFVGNIAKDAVLRWVGPEEAKYPVCDFWVGENLGRSNVKTETTVTPENGKTKKKKDTAWRKVTLWREYAQAMVGYLKQGRRIEVRNGYAGEAEFYVRKNEDGSQTIVPYVPVTVGRSGTIYFMDKKPTEDLPPEAVLNEQPIEGAVVIEAEDLPF